MQMFSLMNKTEQYLIYWLFIVKEYALLVKTWIIELK